jgi:hypothetical protein
MMIAPPNEFKKCPRVAFVPVSEVNQPHCGQGKASQARSRSAPAIIPIHR